MVADELIHTNIKQRLEVFGLFIEYGKYRISCLLVIFVLSDASVDGLCTVLYNLLDQTWNNEKNRFKGGIGVFDAQQNLFCCRFRMIKTSCAYLSVLIH